MADGRANVSSGGCGVGADQNCASSSGEGSRHSPGWHHELGPRALGILKGAFTGGSMGYLRIVGELARLGATGLPPAPRRSAPLGLIAA